MNKQIRKMVTMELFPEEADLICAYRRLQLGVLNAIGDCSLRNGDKGAADAICNGMIEICKDIKFVDDLFRPLKAKAKEVIDYITGGKLSASLNNEVTNE